MGATDKLFQGAKSAGDGMLQWGLQGAKNKRDAAEKAYRTWRMSMQTAATGTIVGAIVSFCVAYFLSLGIDCTKCKFALQRG